MKKTLFIITGAAGIGKTTACHYLCSKYPIVRVVTHTTRAPRHGEKNGVDYYFESAESFDRHHFLESVQYSGAKYGSSIEGLQDAFKRSPYACIVLDTKGAASYLKALNINIVLLFITLGDLRSQTLKQRMQRRGDSMQQIQTRLASEDNQRDYRVPADLANRAKVITNDNWEECKRQLNQVVKKVMIS